jgi:hypothetical protein
MFDDAQKAKIAFILTTIGSLATWAVTEFPNNENVQEWGGLILAILTVIATTYGVWKTANHPTQLPASTAKTLPPT